MTASVIQQRAKISARKLRHGVRRRVFADRREFLSPKGVVSFTFDDVPRSALVNGLPVLDRHDVKATFYVATGFCEHDKTLDLDYDEYLSLSDLRLLRDGAHHIAAHSHSHRHLQRGGETELALDAERNRQILADALEEEIDDFAFPYGEFTYQAKKVLGRQFSSLRGIDPGINESPVDLRLLKSTMLTSDTESVERATELINLCSTSGGWLIFFTHDVSDEPSPFGIAPSDLEQVVQVAKLSDVEVLDVRTARQFCR